MQPIYDVVTLGETMLRFTPPADQRLEQAQSLEVHVGGSESNMVVGLARLGFKVCWLSRLTDNPPGRMIANAIRAQGVDTSQVVWTEADRVGLYFLEEGQLPRGSQVIYDRKDSAMSRMQPEHLPAHLFQAGNARLLHLTGITLALSSGAYATAQRALELAKTAGWLISFDVNYRGKLWSPDDARQGCKPFMEAADLIFLPHRDACMMCDLPSFVPYEAALSELHTLYPQATIVMTLGEQGAAACTPQVQIYSQPIFPAEAVCRLGRGDAFVAGFLYQFLENNRDDDRLPSALRWGTAMAALKYSIEGDMPIVTRSEVETLVNSAGATAAQIAR